VRIIKILCICVLALSGSDRLFSQTTSVQLKVRESKLFGLKGERFASLQLSSRSRTLPLACDSVNAGSFIYFLFRPAGDWTIEPDFVQEDLPKLVLIQNGQTFQIGWKTYILTDSAGSLILLGYAKDIRLNLPFTAQFGLDGASSKADFAIPQEYWPGYSLLTKALADADKAATEKHFHEAIAVYERLMRADSLQIFPQSKELADHRMHSFEGIVSDSWSTFMSSTRVPTTPLKEKISAIDQVTPEVQYVLDSLPSAPLRVSDQDPSVKGLLEHAKDVLAKVKLTRDSLQRSQDDQTVRWISEGAATGKNGPQFEKMIEILAFAFSSLDFADPNRHPLSIRLTPEMQAVLQKYALQESYDIFVRQASERFQKRLPLFPAGFLTNLQKDTASFPLPVYQMLKAVQDYYGSYPAGCIELIRSIVRTCNDPELSRRFDNMRALINLHSRPNQSDLLTILDEAATAEKAGDKDLASDRYAAALRLAPDCAYPAYLCARLFDRSGDQIRARSFYERAYEIDSLYLNAYRDAWTLYQSSGNFKAMIAVLTRALSKGNDFWETNINLGIAYLGDGNLPLAIKQFERALELSPNNYQTNVQLGLAYQTAKDFQKAREYYNKAIFIDPHRPEAVESLQKLDELQKAGR
jgi:tetratricopeptide (TPR) repeat protein